MLMRRKTKRKKKKKITCAHYNKWRALFEISIWLQWPQVGVVTSNDVKVTPPAHVWGPLSLGLACLLTNYLSGACAGCLSTKINSVTCSFWKVG